MHDPTLSAGKSKAVELTKDYLRSQLQKYYCESGGNQASCNSSVEAFVDSVYNTAAFIIEYQKSHPRGPVPVSLVVQFTVSQLQVAGVYMNQDAVACAAAATLFGFSVTELAPAIAINGVIAYSAATSGLGIPLALGAGALALGGAALLVSEGMDSYGTCRALFASGNAASPAANATLTRNRQQAERYLVLLEHQMSVAPNSCTLSRGF